MRKQQFSLSLSARLRSRAYAQRAYAFAQRSF